MQIHPLSVAVGALAVMATWMLAGWSKGPSPLDYMSVVAVDDGFGNMIDTVRFTGCNVQVVNGSGMTDGPINGAGNLIVGYNEAGYITPDRTGSHNLVGGSQNNYSSYGGLVVGLSNTISGNFASVSGGGGVVFLKDPIPIGNTASGQYSSVSGGSRNVASGTGSSVSGGGGFHGLFAPPSGNTAHAPWSSISGGRGNMTNANGSSISGGSYNEAIGSTASISGGCDQIADDECQHLPACEDLCLPDANADATIDVQDLIAVILHWGDCSQ